MGNVDRQLFRSAMGLFATGVTVVTTAGADGAPYGVTVNSFTSVSLEPLLVLICLDNRVSGLEAFSANGRFAVNILEAGQQEISNHFASSGSDRSARIDGVGVTGVPVLSRSLACLECRLSEIVPAGDHQILLGEVESIRLAGEGENTHPLLFFRGGYRKLAE